MIKQKYVLASRLPIIAMIPVRRKFGTKKRRALDNMEKDIRQDCIKVENQ